MKGLTVTEVCCDDWPVRGHWDHPPTSDWRHQTVNCFKLPPANSPYYIEYKSVIVSSSEEWINLEGI